MNIRVTKKEQFSKFGAIRTGDIFRTNLESNNDDLYMKMEEITDGKTNVQGYGTFNAVRLKDGQPVFIDFENLCAVTDEVFSPANSNS